MLRISHERVTSKEVVLVVEGELLGPWVRELEKTCKPFLGNGRRLALDLYQVGFADRAGVDLLKALAGKGVNLACSAFLAELLRPSIAKKTENGPSVEDDTAGH